MEILKFKFTIKKKRLPDFLDQGYYAYKVQTNRQQKEERKSYSASFLTSLDSKANVLA